MKLIFDFFKFSLKKFSKSWYNEISFDKIVVHFLWWKLIVNIRSDYDIVFKNYKEHCAFKISNDEIFLSIIQFKLMNWIDYLNNINIVFKIIKNYLCDFRSIHINRN